MWNWLVYAALIAGALAILGALALPTLPLILQRGSRSRGVPQLVAVAEGEGN